MGLMLAQILLGVALFMAGLPAIVQLLHEWGSSLYIGLILALYSTFVYKNAMNKELSLENE
jgi:heme A synthase